MRNRLIVFVVILLILWLMVPISFGESLSKDLQDTISDINNQSVAEVVTEKDDEKKLVVVLSPPEITAKLLNEITINWLDFLPTILAIVTVVVTAIISYRSLKNSQELADLTITNQNKLFLSQKRQEWIKDLRPIMSDILGMFSTLSNSILLNKIPNLVEGKIHPNDIAKINSQLAEKISLLELHLNFKEQQHRVLVHTCRKIESNINKLIIESKKEAIDIISQQNEGLKKSYTRQSQKILKSEWNRVKLLKM